MKTSLCRGVGGRAFAFEEQNAEAGAEDTGGRHHDRVPDLLEDEALLPVMLLRALVELGHDADKHVQQHEHLDEDREPVVDRRPSASRGAWCGAFASVIKRCGGECTRAQMHDACVVLRMSSEERVLGHTRWVMDGACSDMRGPVDRSTGPRRLRFPYLVVV